MWHRLGEASESKSVHRASDATQPTEGGGARWEIRSFTRGSRDDAEKLSSFYGELFDWTYRELFDWTIDASNPMNYGIVDTGTEDAIGGGIRDAQGGSGHVTFYVQVDDPQAYLDKSESLGGTTVLPVTEVPDMVTFALLADPEGHVVGVVKGD